MESASHECDSKPDSTAGHEMCDQQKAAASASASHREMGGGSPKQDITQVVLLLFQRCSNDVQHS